MVSAMTRPTSPARWLVLLSVIAFGVTLLVVLPRRDAAAPSSVSTAGSAVPGADPGATALRSGQDAFPGVAGVSIDETEPPDQVTADLSTLSATFTAAAKGGPAPEVLREALVALEFFAHVSRLDRNYALEYLHEAVGLAEPAAARLLDYARSTPEELAAGDRRDRLLLCTGQGALRTPAQFRDLLDQMAAKAQSLRVERYQDLQRLLDAEGFEQLQGFLASEFDATVPVMVVETDPQQQDGAESAGLAARLRSACQSVEE
jgi:hypothetical protein